MTHQPPGAESKPKPNSRAPWRGGVVAIALALCAQWALAMTPDPEQYNGFDVSNASIPVQSILRGGPPRDGIPSIDAPKFVAAAQAGLQDADRVLGLNLNGVIRAYPVRILNWHEVVNDRLGHQPVVVTYCPLCGTGVAFHAVVAGQATVFGVSGLLYNSDVLLYDRASQSLWSQMLQTAVSGPRKGTPLQQVPLTHTTWADWRSRFPATEVLSMQTGFQRDYGRDPYRGYDRVQQLMFDVEHQDNRFPIKEWVVGVEVNGKHKAYPFSELARAVNSSGELVDRVANKTLRVRYDRAHGTAEVFDESGKLWPSTMSFWFAWFAFHPKTEVLRSP